MARKLEEIVAVFRQEKQRWDETVLVECDLVGGDMFDSGVTIKTTAEVDELKYGHSYRFYGAWSVHPKYGKQFHARTFVRCQPHGQAGTLRYLMDAPNVGQSVAAKLWKAFAGDAVRILRETPEQAAAAVGGQFTDEKAREASEWLVTQQAMENCTLDLMDLLTGKGFPRSIGKRAVQKWGNKAAEIIRNNPYELMSFRGCGFKRCDDMYIELGHNPKAMQRQAYAIWYIIARDREGHTWHRNTDIAQQLAQYIGIGTDVIAAAKLAKSNGLIAVRRDTDGGVWLAESRRAENEATVATRAAAMLDEGGVAWPSVDGLDVSDHQRDELQNALTRRIGIFAGSPGTGKTYSVARLIGAVGERDGWESVAVCCPTGKAASRITEAMQGYGLPLRAKTIHSLLKVASKEEGEGWGFEHNETNPLPFRYVFLDEASMPDADIMAALLRALPAGAHLMLVGDTNQLPPVGHGAPLRDLITAGVPKGELTEIRRNAGSIVRACAEIRDGRKFNVDSPVDPDSGMNLGLLETHSGTASLERVVKAIGKMREYGIDPIWDCQVIVAVNAKSDLSRKAVNQRLQSELNPSGYTRDGVIFRVDDKIVCLKNGLNICDETDITAANIDQIDGKVFVANGEIGRVIAIEEKFVTAMFDAPKRVIKIILAAGGEADETKDADDAGANGSKFDLAYAISCHKSQGSEFPVVFVVLDEYPGARMVCSREWIYTAISRAKRACFLVGKMGTADSMIRRRALHKRKTFLAELVREEVSQQPTAGEKQC